jgi:hypothetical protein
MKEKIAPSKEGNETEEQQRKKCIAKNPKNKRYLTNKRDMLHISTPPARREGNLSLPPVMGC